MLIYPTPYLDFQLAGFIRPGRDQLYSYDVLVLHYFPMACFDSYLDDQADKGMDHRQRIKLTGMSFQEYIISSGAAHPSTFID